MQPDPSAQASEARPLILAAGAIFKNEGPYILEWIAFHQTVGVSRFFIADNMSDDGSSNMLAALDRAGIIHHIPFPGRSGEPPQLPAYTEILRRCGDEVDWIAFIDADEFLVPEQPEQSIPTSIAALDARVDVGAVAVSWAVYGSGGESHARPELVIERFRAHAARGHPLNHHYKSIVRTAACSGVAWTPHAFELLPGFRTVHPDGSDVALVRPDLPGRARAVHWSPFRLNHYVVKSREEFESKRSRGRATRLDAPRSAGFFAKHDLNEENTPMAPSLVDAVRARKARILRALATVGWNAGEPAFRPAAARGAGILAPAASGRRGRLQAKIDRVEVSGRVMELRGWALSADGGRVAALLLVSESGRTIEPLAAMRRERPDVVAHFPGAVAASGFVLAFALGDLPAGRLLLRAISANGNTFDVQVQRSEATPPPHPAAVPDAPMMPPRGAATFAEAIAGARAYLEYGSGGSTVLAVTSRVPGIVSVESDELWHAAVRRRLTGRLLPGHHLEYIDIGPTSRFGYPVSEAAWRQFARYPLDPWRICRESSLSPDLVLIDGRFRVACLYAALINAAPGCRVLFDDYANRAAYHRVSALARPSRVIDRMAEFIVPEARATEALWPALIEALGDPL